MSGWGVGASNFGGPFLPTAGGTMTGGITLANVAATVTSGGSTATWTPTALTYTFQSLRGATDATNSFTIDHSNTLGVATGSIFRITEAGATRNLFRMTYANNDYFTIWTLNNVDQFEIELSSGLAKLFTPTSATIPSDITIQAGASSGGVNAGGDINLITGAGNNGAGGALTQTTGAGSGAGAGGNWTVTCGAGGATGSGGSVTITSGIGGSTSSNCGDVSLVGASAGTGSGNGGGINLTSGNGSATGTGSRGGSIAIVTGNGDGSIARQSGPFSVTTGTPSSTGASGGIAFTTGVGGSVSGVSGGITLQTGTTTSGTTGSISLVVGTPTAGTTGDIAFTGARNITLTGAGTPVMTLISDDADAAGGPDLTLYRNSATSAAADVMGRILFDGNSATPTQRTMGVIQSVLVTATDGAEDAKLEFYTIAGGASNLAVWFAETGQIHADLGGGAGNVTVFDDHDDVGLIRSMYDLNCERRERSLESLSGLGLVSRKPGGSGWAMAIQPWMALLSGGIYQTADRVSVLESENKMLRARVTALEAQCRQ